MADYSDFPPVEKFKQVLRSYPQSALIYASLWGLAKQGALPVTVIRQGIKKKFLISPTLFRNHLLALGRLGILTFDESIDYFNIEFITYD